MTPLSPFSHMGGVGGSGGGGGMTSGTSSASSHQVAIDMSSTGGGASTSPQTTRRLLPRIITKKTDNSTVVLVGETRTPGKAPFSSTASPSSHPESLSTSYISPGSGDGGWRTSACSSNRNDLTSSQILSNSSSSTVAATTTQKKTDSATGIVHKKDHNIHLATSGGAGSGGGAPSLSGTATSKTTSSSCRLAKQMNKGKSCGATGGKAPAAQKSKGVRNVVRFRNVPSYISAHYRNGPIKKLKHPLEENIFSSLFITLFAVAVALVVGVPILCGLGVIVVGVVGIRYIIVIFHGMASYSRFICSNRQPPSNSRCLPPHIFPRDRLAFANDVRWLGKKRRSQCQSIIHTLLVFEGSMDITTLRHLIQTRVLRAETPEGELAYPRLLQKLVNVTAGFMWELDLTFDIQNHIFAGPTHFKCEQELQQYIGRLLTQDLPMSRPLWEIRVLPSYYGSGKDTMAILRVHQCLADGMSLIRILSHSLADHQLMHVPQRPHFAGMSFGFNLLRSLIVGPLTIFLWWFTTFRDKNLFSVPLPKIHRRQSRRKWWWSRLWMNPLRWFTGHATVIFRNGQGGDEEEDKVSFTSSLGSNSSTWSDSCDDSDNGSEHSSGSISSGVNNRKRGKFAQAFRSPVQSSSKEDELTTSPKDSRTNVLQIQQTTPTQETTEGAPSNLQHDQRVVASSSKSAKSNPVFEGILGRNLNKCLGKKLSASKSSLQCQQDPPASPQHIGKSDKTRGTATGGSSGKCKSKKNKKKKKRKRRGGGHHHHHHRRKKFLSSGRKTSLASNSSGSSFNSSSSSTPSSFSSSTRPATWNVVWSAPMTLPKVARVKQIMRSSYNDVLLSAAAGSIRMYMQDQGVPYPGDLQVVIPVDLRNDIASPKQSTRLGCKVSSVLATIPSGMESAIPRLWATRHRLDELKASADSVVAYGATTILMNMLPHRIAIPILESIVNKASLQFSNLPGPTATTVIGGYPLKGIYPIYPPPGRVRAAISVLTYADQVHVTVLTHRSLANAGPKLLKGMTEQVEQLSRQLSQRRVPGESRRSTRNFNQVNNAEITKPPTRQIQLQLQCVQEELAQLNSQLEAQGIVLSEEEYGFLTGSGGLGRRIISSTAGISSTSQQHQGLGERGGGEQYHVQHYHHHHPPHHHHHHHHHHPSSQEQTTDEPTACTSGTSSMELSTSGQVELQLRLKTLKNEFAQLIGELRRRSSIVEGIAMSFEDAENEEEYRKPRKRALSVVSMTRRSSIFSSRSNTAPDSPVYSSDEELPSSPPMEVRHQPQSSGSGQIATSASSSSAGYPTPTPNIRHSSSPMRTTAV